MPIKKSKHINLIPQNEFETSSFGRIVKWALSTFRILVIVTELVVMSAFLSRFWLDSKNSDLNEEIETSKSLIVAYQDIESEFRSIQKRIDIAKNFYSNLKINAILSDISKSMPIDIVLTSISKSDDKITIKAVSTSEQSVAQFITNLEQIKTLSDLSLSQITSEQESSTSINFSVSTKIKI